MPEECNHLPAFSEPTLTLHCTVCGEWLRDEDGVLKVVPCADTTRGIYDCPRCDASWIGDDDYCWDCAKPTWDTGDLDD